MSSFGPLDALACFALGGLVMWVLVVLARSYRYRQEELDEQARENQMWRQYAADQDWISE